MKKSNFLSNVSQEVSRVHSTQRRDFRRNLELRTPMGKGQIQRRKKLNPYYVVGFIDGEGSFCVSINKHKTVSRRIEIKPEFTIELRADDREILERILITIGCGKIYDCSYDKYGWHPHVKYKIGSTKEMERFLIPFLDKHPPQAKKAKVYALFREIVLIIRRKEHLKDRGFERVKYLRNQIRKYGKKHNYKYSI